MTRRVLVLTEKGRVIGAQIVTETPPGPAAAALHAGPGQKIHEVQVEVPGGMLNAREIDAFHRMLAARLKPARRPAKKRR